MNLEEICRDISKLLTELGYKAPEMGDNLPYSYGLILEALKDLKSKVNLPEEVLND